MLPPLDRSYPAPLDTCKPPVPPADPRAPDLRPVEADYGPNQFEIGVDGPDPALAVGGSHDQQEQQRDYMLALATRGFASYLTGHTPGTPRYPSDGDVRNILADLNTNPPIGEVGVDVTRAVYQSNIPNATAQEAYQHFVDNPEQVFGAGGMEIRPPAGRLEDGGRYMLETGGPPPTWLPVEIRLDPDANAITINTLDGHVLRGTQTFTFTDDCNGGAVLSQDAIFQGSTQMVGDIQQLASVSGGQHNAWENAHREIYGQFNGDQDYTGIGTSAVSPDLIKGWGEMLKTIAADPGNFVDVLVDSGGELANETIDHWGGWAGDFLDWTGIPGGGVVRDVTDTIGDGVSTVADVGGDLIELGLKAKFW
ncbi:hypothetical protein AZ78_4532 [Lysobacter capsici AZ78]|uniref:Uncharacterized protein n=1 Tax=Lysobacter capsici AZ78 TaxID=1444315 RepID=A0A108UD79_9GAMM|nr:hypothetical protein [Lysobacter capsici]KWS06972.1 hypothetical protein AZ78_4532 [Lysobacter capsici AZ78]